MPLTDSLCKVSDFDILYPQNMSFDGQRLLINGDPLVQQEARPVVFSRYFLKGVHLPHNVWPGIDRTEDPSNLRHIDTAHLGPDSLFTSPEHNVSVYTDEELSDLFGIIKRERIFDLGLSALEGLASRSPKIVPKVEVKVDKTLFNRKEKIPEDVVVEFLKRQEDVDINLLGKGYYFGDRLIMSYKLGYASPVSPNQQA